MRRVLKDDNLEKEFQENGYISVPFISESEVAELKKIFFDTLPESGGQISSGDIEADSEHLITYDFTFIDKNPEYKRKVFDIITKHFESQMNSLLQDYKPIIANFIRKKPEAGEVPLHQNWAFADEQLCSTVSIWCPLVDSTVQNGTLQVVPKSHKRFGENRGPMVPSEIEGIKNEIIENHLVPLETKAGNCVVLDDSIVHYSAINKTDGLRLAIQLICIPKELPSLHYHLNHAKSPKKIQVLEVDKDFYMEFNPWKFPENTKKVKELDLKFKPLTEKEFIDGLNNPRFDEKSQNSKPILEKKKLRNLKNKMKPLFKDKETQEFFNKYGFAKIKMLDEKTVKELYDYYNSEDLSDKTGYGFNMSIENEDKEKAKRVREKIFELALPKALPHLVDDAQVIAGSYVVKENNPQGVVPPHQDWTFVENEGENYSVTCWIPLVPTKMENGYLGVIKGSHLIYDNKRPSPSPQVPTPLMNHLFSIFPYLEMYEMEPGEALIFDHRTFHASTPNITEEPRIAIGLGFTQGDSQLRHFNMKQNGKMDTLQVFEADKDFSVIYDNARLSKMFDKGEEIQSYKKLREEPYTYPDPSSDELLDLIKAAGNTFNVELCEHMAKLFNYNMDGSQKENSEEEVKKEEEAKPQETKEEETLPFWKVYTPLNIVREIKYRLTGS